jgi:hypothetical protein
VRSRLWFLPGAAVVAAALSLVVVGTATADGGGASVFKLDTCTLIVPIEAGVPGGAPFFIPGFEAFDGSGVVVVTPSGVQEFACHADVLEGPAEAGTFDFSVEAFGLVFRCRSVATTSGMLHEICHAIA